MLIESEIMVIFGCSRCPNYHSDLPDMIGSFESGATVSLMEKNGNNKNFSNVLISYCNFVLSRGINWLKAFFTFYKMVDQNYATKFQVHSTQIEGMTVSVVC